MENNPDYRDLLRCLNAATARYLIVGAYAVTFHTEPRYTRDIDVWVEPTVENAARVWKALADFGAPLDGLTQADFTKPDLVYQIGIEPNRIDILMGISGVAFASAWERRVESEYGGERITYLGLNDLIRAKEAAGRPQDLIDLELLRRRAAKRP